MAVVPTFWGLSRLGWDIYFILFAYFGFFSDLCLFGPRYHAMAEEFVMPIWKRHIVVAFACGIGVVLTIRCGYAEAPKPMADNVLALTEAAAVLNVCFERG